MKSSEQINDLIDASFDFFSSIVGNLASNIAPLLAGILPAYLTWIHIVNALHFPIGVAWAGAGVIEFIGLGAGNELMKVWFHNRKYKDERLKMPLLAPGSAAVWYVLIMIAFNIILDAQPESHFWRIVSIALFATLAIPGYALVAGKSLRKEWALEHSKELRERREERMAEQERAERVGGQQNRADGVDQQTLPVEEEYSEPREYASDYAEQIESVLERIWQGTGKIASPAEIVRVLNGNGANLDARKSSGYISTLSKNWRISQGIQIPNNGNGSQS